MINVIKAQMLITKLLHILSLFKTTNISTFSCTRLACSLITTSLATKKTHLTWIDVTKIAKYFLCNITNVRNLGQFVINQSREILGSCCLNFIFIFILYWVWLFNAVILLNKLSLSHYWYYKGQYYHDYTCSDLLILKCRIADESSCLTSKDLTRPWTIDKIVEMQMLYSAHKYIVSIC